MSTSSESGLGAECLVRDATTRRVVLRCYEGEVGRPALRALFESYPDVHYVDVAFEDSTPEARVNARVNLLDDNLRELRREWSEPLLPMYKGMSGRVLVEFSPGVDVLGLLTFSTLTYQSAGSQLRLVFAGSTRALPVEDGIDEPVCLLRLLRLRPGVRYW